MALRSKIYDLGDGYIINAMSHEQILDIYILHNETNVGLARFVTDHVDVRCITFIKIHPGHVNYLFSDNHTLGEWIIRFFINFPSIVNKYAFQFILDVPENLKDVVKKYHFSQGSSPDIKNKFMLRVNNFLPGGMISPQNTVLVCNLTEHRLPQVLHLLQKNAYWQSRLTLERLNLLVKTSQCFIAIQDDDVIGFARVLTDGTFFASMWDVVVADAYRGQGVCMTLMDKIFTNSLFSSIKNWVLFTDTASRLYSKYGFILASDALDDSFFYGDCRHKELYETPNH